ncbi:MAG: KH domain-containing protein [Bradymonadaceae bacterium]
MASTEEQAIAQHVELARYLAVGLLGEEVEFEATGRLDRDQIRIELHVPESDRGRVIGRGGRLARAMRNILSASGLGTHRNIVLDIVD